MRIAVMAAGAVGGYFGARMAAAGHEVHFIARGAHLEAIRKDGLKIESPLGNLHLKDANVTDDPAKVGPVDIVLFAVKLWDTEKAAEQAKPLIGKDTRARSRCRTASTASSGSRRSSAPIMWSAASPLSRR